MGAIGYYFWYLLRYALNIPYQDEIYDVLGFLSEIVKSEDWLTSLQLFFIKWNEHSTASSRLFYYLSYRLFGEVNFVTLTVLANTALPVFVGLLYLRLREHDYRWLILLPVVFMLFSFRA
jgi:carbon starvation protein CstA